MDEIQENEWYEGSLSVEEKNHVTSKSSNFIIFEIEIEIENNAIEYSMLITNKNGFGV